MLSVGLVPEAVSRRKFATSFSSLEYFAVNVWGPGRQAHSCHKTKTRVIMSDIADARCSFFFVKVLFFPIMHANVLNSMLEVGKPGVLHQLLCTHHTPQCFHKVNPESMLLAR